MTDRSKTEKIYLTYKTRMLTEARLIAKAKFYNFLMAWFSFCSIIFSIMQIFGYYSGKDSTLIFNGTYGFTRFKERLILRGASREPRQISIPTVRDRLTLRAVCQVLHRFEPRSVGPSPHKVVDQVVRAIRGGDGDRAFVRVDVKNFFPSIIHARLEKALSQIGLGESVKHLCMAAVSTPTGTLIEPNSRGVPHPATRASRTHDRARRRA